MSNDKNPTFRVKFINTPISWIVLLAISLLFNVAVFKIDNYNLEKLQSVQNAGMAQGARIRSSCEQTVNLLNQSQNANRQGFVLQAQIAQNNINGIDQALKSGLIPANLKGYYTATRARQVQNLHHFNQLANALTPYQDTICGN